MFASPIMCIIPLSIEIALDNLVESVVTKAGQFILVSSSETNIFNSRFN